MKSRKKLISYILLGLSLTFLTSIYQNFATKYDEIFKDDKINVEVKFGSPEWHGNYCTFPNMSISEQTPNTINTIQISYSGNDTTNANITAPSKEGFTALDNTNTLVTYTTTKTAYDVQEFLKSIKYQCNNSQSISILLSESGIPNDTHYFPGTGHFYKYVLAEGIPWINAYNGAQSANFGGWKGYLANVLSEEENQFILKYAGNSSENSVGWLGGTTSVLNNINTNNASFTSASENKNYWYWSGGPELCATLKPEYSSWTIKNKGRAINKEESNYFNYNYTSPNPENSVFYNTAIYKSSVGFSKHMPFDFNMWNNDQNGTAGKSEPNGTIGSEPVLETIKGSNMWNNMSITGPTTVGEYYVYGYTIEYGDRLWGNSTSLENSIIVSTEIGKPVTIKYRYNNSEGTGNFTDDIVYYNTTISQALDKLPEPTTIPKDYTFEGWYTAASGGTKVELTSNVASLLGGTYNTELNLYAQWHIDEDISKPEIRSITLTHEDSGQEIEYVSGHWSRSDVKAKYIVSDPYVSGAQTSGIDISKYYISLDAGKNYYSAASSPPTGVTEVTALEDELSFKVTLEGQHNLKIKVTDKKGNFTESESKSLIIDKTKPLTPTDVNSPATSYTNVNTPTISGKGEAKCTVTIKEGDDVLQTALVGDDSSWKTTLASLTDGVHNLSITQSDPAGNTSGETSINLKIDTVGPLGEINIKENKFTTFLNKITFGMFFKDTIDVTFKASDENGSGIKTIEYLKSDSEFQTKEEAILALGWQEIESNNAFSINVNNNSDKFIIYSRITDNAGNVTCINSNGVVVYTDSAQETSELVFTKTNTNDLDAIVKLNGNTINNIINSTKNELLTPDNHYSVLNNTITFRHAYLDSLQSGDYTLTVHYNPGGQPFSPEGLGSNQPATTSIKLTVQKAVQSAITITGINSPYTYGDNSFAINADGGSGSGSVSYLSSDETVASISGSTVNILKVGTFTITATKGADENYNEMSTTNSLITVNPKPVSITGLIANSKVYDATPDASMSGTPNIVGKLDKDNITLNSGQAIFQDSNAQTSKTVHFSGFSLGGTDVSNYTLSSQPADVLANIDKRPVTIMGIGANDKVYDATITAKISINGKAEIVDNLDDENLVLGIGSASFGDKSSGTNKMVTFKDFTISGSASSNYTLASQPAPVSSNITPKDLNVTNLFVENKPYDGLNTAIISSTTSLDGVVSGDDVSLTNGEPTFSSVDIDENIPINFSSFYLSGPDSNNYSLIQPSGITANIFSGFIPQINSHYTLNTPDGYNSWYISNNFIITASTGYSLSTENKDESSWQNTLSYSQQTADFEVVFYVRNLNSKEISSSTSEHYKKDTENPTGTVEIKQNEFKNFLNTITFGMFFKDKIDVKISESDNLSGTAKIEYFKSDIVYSNGHEIPPSSWIDGGTINDNSISFTVDPQNWDLDQVNEKFFVYTKITDYAGNICYLRSDGVVIYTDSTASTSSISFTKTSPGSQFANVNLNGNTIKAIFNDSYELLPSSDYNINGHQIEFKSSYLDSLKSGEYTLTIHYNPAGMPYDDSPSNSKPLTTSLKVSILRASQTPFDIVGLNSSYTYGDDPFEVSIDGAVGTGAVSFVSSDTSVAKVDSNIVTILNKGFFTITAIKESDENYDSQSMQSHIVTVNPKPVSLDQIQVYDKVYDGTSQAQISKDPIISGNIDAENLSIVIGKAFFDSKDAGQEKTVTFTDFSLEGTSLENYTLVSQPNPVKANITKRAVNIQGLSAANKIYDGNTDAQITSEPKIINKIDQDRVEVKYGKANFYDKNMGTSKMVMFYEFDITGDQSHNYFLESQPADVFADISQKELEIINININSKTYDKTINASFKSSPELSGLIAGDNTSLVIGEPSFTSSEVSENIPIEFTQFLIDGEDSKNYYLKAQPGGITSNITPKELIIKNLKIKDKIFDGYDTAEFETTPTLEGVISPDEVILLVGNPTFKFKDVSHNVPIIFTPEFSIYGKDSSNYSLASHPQISANINMSQAFNQRDPSTNLWVEAPSGVFPEDSKLVVEKFSDNSPGYERIFYDLDEDKKQMAERLRLFEIHVTDINGDIIQPNTDNGLVTVRIPVTDDFDLHDLEVYRVLFDLPDDEFNEYVVTLNGNHYCEFKTNHFSPYALVDKKNDNNFLKIIIISSSSILLLLIFISIFFLISKKNYNILNS